MEGSVNAWRPAAGWHGNVDVATEAAERAEVDVLGCLRCGYRIAEHHSRFECCFLPLLLLGGARRFVHGVRCPSTASRDVNDLIEDLRRFRTNDREYLFQRVAPEFHLNVSHRQAVREATKYCE
ncbi:hypothetical protein Csp2054_01215 [Curtobacterium sp. 'Ferrero']|nr:hypothetical protein Csp2054_01215 [Curtobacterium sp. 'Ferrero']